MDSEENRSNWKSDLSLVLNAWHATSNGVVLSADVDGLLSCALVASRFPVHVLGIYTTTHLVLLDGATPADAANALWLDHDVSEIGIKCVGQHLVHHMPGDTLPLREPVSFNPNAWLHQSWKESFRGRKGKTRDKYPYGTCHFLANALDFEVGTRANDVAALFAHADGTWRTVVDYEPNATIWYDLMFQGDEFLQVLRERWSDDTQCLDRHEAVVERLIRAGVSKSLSRAKIAALLPENLKALTGSQSIRYLPTNNQEYVDRVYSVLTLCAAAIGSKPTCGRTPTSIVSGTRETPYPNRIDSFDEFMIDNKIFSHAFTDLRTLSYTTGIHLTG